MFDRLKKYAPEDYFAWMETFLYLLSLQPPRDNLRNKILYVLLAGPHLLLVLLLGTILEWIELMHIFKEENLTVTMFSLAFSVFHASVFVRTAHWLANGVKIKELIAAIQRDTFNFGCFSVYKIELSRVFEMATEVEAATKFLTYEDLGSIWTHAKIFVDHKRNAVERFRKEKMSKCRLLCSGFYLSYNISGAFSLVLLYWSVVGNEYQSFNPRINATSTYGIYPVQVYYPFDTSLSHGHYWIAYFYQIYAQTYISFLFLAFEWFFMNSIIHLINQVSVVGEAFKKVDDNIDCKQDGREVMLLQEIRIVRCMTELQDIYRTIGLFEDLFTMMMLVDTLQMTCVICSLTYSAATLEITDYGCMVTTFILMLAILQIFAKCCCCQVLLTEFENTLRAICGLNWTGFSPKIRSSLLLLISRVQTPASITAGKFFLVDLALYVQVVQKAYSFYTLVRNTTDK